MCMIKIGVDILNFWGAKTLISPTMVPCLILATAKPKGKNGTILSTCVLMV